MADERKPPANLPYSWMDVWEYTLDRSSGSTRRRIIREILSAGKLELFDPVHVLSGDISDLWMYYKTTGQTDWENAFK